MARLLFISHKSNLGGPVYSLLKLIKYLSQEHEIAVVAPGCGEVFGVLKGMGIPTYRVEPSGLTWSCIPWLSRLIFQGRFDLVYGNNYSSGTRNALIASKLVGRPFVWHIREMLWEAHWRTAFFLKYADAIIAVSQVCAQSVKHYVPKKDINVVYNGVDLEEFQTDVMGARQGVSCTLGISQEHLVIVSVGNVCVRKGQGYTVKVATEVLKNHPTAIFVFLGRLDLEPEYALCLQQEVFRCKLEEKVRFLGFCDNVPKFLQGCDIFLHTAIKDPNPRAVLEAMAAKLPVVAFDVDGIKEMVIHGETGFLVPVGNISAMKEALGELLGNLSLRTRMGEKARERVQTMFNAKETTKRVSSIINHLLKAR